MRARALGVMLAATASDCPSDPGPWPGYDAWVIEEGDHYASTALRLVTDPVVSFDAVFDESAIYTTEDPANQGDINKLWGFSDCGAHHHTDSARFGWRWIDDALEIHAYTYVDGVRISERLGVAALDTSYAYAIEIVDDTYVFTFDGVETVLERGCDTSGGLRYQLWPYFGGDETAPQDITLWIREG